MNVSNIPDEVTVEHVGGKTGSVEIRASVLTISFPYFARKRVASHLREAAEDMHAQAAAAEKREAFHTEEMREAAGVGLQLAERLENL